MDHAGNRHNYVIELSGLEICAFVALISNNLQDLGVLGHEYTLLDLGHSISSQRKKITDPLRF